MKDIYKNIHFTVDAGLIQRLGYELVAKAETAVSELIKNAYDADSTTVEVNFMDYWCKGGTMIIKDDGHGMTYEQLQTGFMRISSSDKIHNPTSPKFKRTKAGRKGIGRFATQRLSEKLIIISQTADSDIAIKVEIDWNKYVSDIDITSITFPVQYIPKEQYSGTILILENLRDVWTMSSIKRIHRYVMELFQPAYLSDRSKENNSATLSSNNSFNVVFNEYRDGNYYPIVNDNIAIFSKALAVFNGKIDSNYNASVKITSDALGINDSIEIHKSNTSVRYVHVKDVYFKVYYFIYNRPSYYNSITKFELKAIQDLSQTASGVKLYRNGFRVLPYGEPSNDWTNIDRRWSSESGVANIPLGNKNLFGYVEITDPEGILFEETSSREGLIENDSFNELLDFINKSLVACRGRIAEAITVIKQNSTTDSTDNTSNTNKNIQSTQDELNELYKIIENSDKSETSSLSEEEKQRKEQGHKLLNSLRSKLEEINMLRVLAGMGLTIGEFSHEIKQFNPAIQGYISSLQRQNLSEESMKDIDGIKENISHFIAYTSYFNTTVSQNINRQLEILDISKVIDKFKQTINNDLIRSSIDFDIDYWDYGLIETVPMHRSEWSSILFNLYTNSKKAINREKTSGKILVEIGYEVDNIFIKFHDNGDGIPEENKHRVFNTFFTTSTPAGFDAPINDELCGTGLGLKIVKDIINTYKGNIIVDDPNPGYATCFKITIPKNIQ